MWKDCVLLLHLSIAHIIFASNVFQLKPSVGARSIGNGGRKRGIKRIHHLKFGAQSQSVSTGGQTTENQLRELRAAAERLGHQVVAEYADNGISGSKGRDQRPGLNSLLEGVTRRDFDKVMAWSVDRLGRSLPHLLTFMGELKSKNIDLYLHQQSLDTSTPAGKAMFQMLGVFSEFEREIIRERVLSGLERAKAQGKKLGRPRRDDAKRLAAIRKLRKQGTGILKIARTLRIGVSVVQRAVRTEAYC
jgi:DNA invertase Pin-like site-specific DNA recombinase